MPTRATRASRYVHPPKGVIIYDGPSLVNGEALARMQVARRGREVRA
jgi:hypothetical protein